MKKHEIGFIFFFVAGLVGSAIIITSRQSQTISVEQAIKDRHFAWEEGYRYGVKKGTAIIEHSIHLKNLGTNIGDISAYVDKAFDEGLEFGKTNRVHEFQ